MVQEVSAAGLSQWGCVYQCTSGLLLAPSKGYFVPCHVLQGAPWPPLCQPHLAPHGLPLPCLPHTCGSFSRCLLNHPGSQARVASAQPFLLTPLPGSSPELRGLPAPSARGEGSCPQRPDLTLLGTPGCAHKRNGSRYRGPKVQGGGGPSAHLWQSPNSPQPSLVHAHCYVRLAVTCLRTPL